MIIHYHSNFKKSFKKRVEFNNNLVNKYKERIKLFEIDKSNTLLKDHALTGLKKGQRAFWVTGDIRVIYIPFSSQEVTFVDIGSHNQVY